MESQRIVPGSFNIWAFLLTWMWYFAKGLWGKGLIVLVGQAVLAGLFASAAAVLLCTGPAGLLARGEELARNLLTSVRVGAFIGWLCTGIYCGRTANLDLYLAVKQREKLLAG